MSFTALLSSNIVSVVTSSKLSGNLACYNCKSISSLYVQYGEHRYQFSFVKTPRKFVIAKLLICKLRSFISGSALMKIRAADRKLCNNKFTSCYHKTKLVLLQVVGNKLDKCAKNMTVYLSTDKYQMTNDAMGSNITKCTFYKPYGPGYTIIRMLKWLKWLEIMRILNPYDVKHRLEI